MIEIRILGPLEISAGNRLLPLRGSTQRAVLAVLVLNRNRVVPWERLVDELWTSDPPGTARKMIHNAVSQLRKLLSEAAGVEASEEILVTRGGGYLLRLEPGQVDADRFEQLVEEGRAARERRQPGVSAAKLREALTLWRGPALTDLAHEPFARAEAARLEELRLAALEERLEAELALGHHAEVVGELEALVADYPLRERFRAQLMLALYRSGRQAEALDVYQSTRRLLVDELGIEPGPELQRLERAILVHDAALEPPAAAPAPHVAVQPAAVPIRAAREARKTVSVLFADLVSLGPRLDPEALRRLTTRALDALSYAVERHGGLVERMPSGGLMAIFGVPLVHEDDALRAVRAAVEVREAMAVLTDELERGWGARIAVRAAVDTGEVVVGDAALGHPIVAGEAVDLAARLRQAAEPGELLIGEATRRLVDPFVLAEPAADGGGAEKAWRLLAVREPMPTAAPETPLVGREGELAQLRQAFERAVHERTPYLFTVLGPAGIGKSRLVAELASELAEEATVLAGRCLSYGAGTTFRPLAEMVRQAAGEVSREAIARLLPGGPEASTIADRVAGAIGVAETEAGRGELLWAARKLLEALARERPLVAVFDDLHWAEPTLLDLIEHVTDWAREAPILLVCLARPELLETRPMWAGGKLNATTILLEPLSAADSEKLIAHLGGSKLRAELRARIAEAAEGNPLFLEQMLAVVGETPPGAADPVVPPTIQALLAARLDRLDPEERAVLERASVAGKEFVRAAVVELTEPSERARIDAALGRLTQKDLIRPTASALAGHEAFRFRHSLIRETTYESLPKESRAELHERFATWLEGAVADRLGQYEALIGYHLERASRYHAELGPVTEQVRELERRAATRLAAAGSRAHARGDMPAAVGLLSRSEKLLADGSPEQLEVRRDLAEALRETGEFERADRVLAEVARESETHGHRGLAAHAVVSRLRIRIQTDPLVSTEEVVSDIRGAVDVFEELGDDRGLARAWEVLAWVPWFRCRAAEAQVALRKAIEHARRAGESRSEAQSLNLLVGAAFFGPMPVPEAIRLCEDVLGERSDQPRVVASAMRALAGLKAMEGEFDEARSFAARHKAIVEDLGLRVNAGWAAETYGIVELLAGDAAAAERELRTGFELLQELGDTGFATLAALTAQAVCVQGRYEEALRISDVSEQAATQEALFSEFQRRTVRARILAALRRVEEAERVGQEAVSLAEGTDFLVARGDALAALAEAVKLAGRTEEAVSLIARALDLYDRKQDVVSARRARATLAELGQAGVGRRR